MLVRRDSRSFVRETFLLGPKTVVGRGTAYRPDFVGLDGVWVSRRHCVIAKEGVEYFIEDLKSLNGTFVNGLKISAPTELKYGDVVCFGPPQSNARNAFVFALATISRSSSSFSSSASTPPPDSPASFGSPVLTRTNGGIITPPSPSIAPLLSSDIPAPSSLLLPTVLRTRASLGNIACLSPPPPNDESEDEKAPPDFLCPILRSVMRDPVLADDCHSYERWAISNWLQPGQIRSPLTSKLLRSRRLRPNHTLKKAIDEWRSKREAAKCARPPPSPAKSPDKRSQLLVQMREQVHSLMTEQKAKDKVLEEKTRQIFRLKRALREAEKKSMSEAKAPHQKSSVIVDQPSARTSRSRSPNPTRSSLRVPSHPYRTCTRSSSLSNPSSPPPSRASRLPPSSAPMTRSRSISLCPDSSPPSRASRLPPASAPMTRSRSISLCPASPPPSRASRLPPSSAPITRSPSPPPSRASRLPPSSAPMTRSRSISLCPASSPSSLVSRPTKRSRETGTTPVPRKSPRQSSASASRTKKPARSTGPKRSLRSNSVVGRRRPASK